MPAIQQALPSSSPEENAASGGVPSGRVLPKGCVPMNDVLEGKLKPGSFVNVVGLVRDVQLPIPSRGTDYKMAIKLYDKSLELLDSTLAMHLFCSKEAMPTVGPGDVVLIRLAKLQMYLSTYSLLKNQQTTIFIYPSADIRPLPLQAEPVVRHWAMNRKGADPTRQEHEYVSWLYHNIDKGAIPDLHLFNEQATRSLMVPEKFSTLQGVKDGRFHDLTVSVVHKPFDASGYVALWVSDYTENPLFRDYPDPGTTTDDRQAGDPHAYLSKFGGANQRKDWAGPSGKRSMQITCFEPNAEYIRSYVRAGDWVHLKNVQIRMGRDGQYLEGFMRDDPRYNSPIRVERIVPSQLDRDSIDQPYKQALRRKREYETKVLKSQRKKRKATDETPGESKPDNARQRRRKTRARKQPPQNRGGKEDEDGSDGARLPRAPLASDLNSAIVSNHQDQLPTPLSNVIEPAYQTIQINRQGKQAELRLPFVNTCFRAQVRVVDFLPARLDDFAVSRKTSEYDLLSDNEDEDGGSSAPDVPSSSEEDDSGNARGTLNGHVGERVWEWRFALLLEDATPSREEGALSSYAPRPRIWAVIDNIEAQMLTGLNACELRRDQETLQELREKMFLLWGNLEETKRAAAQAARKAKEAAKREAAQAKEAERRIEQDRLRQQQERALKEMRKQHAVQNGSGLKNYPTPAYSSDCEREDGDGSGSQKMPRVSQQETPPLSQEDSKSSEVQQVSNRPFICCVRQYGVRVRPEDSEGGRSGTSHGEGGDGHSTRRSTWQQMFGLFGTKISNVY